MARLSGPMIELIMLEKSDPKRRWNDADGSLLRDTQIACRPFLPANVGPCSIDLRLGHELRVYPEDEVLDTRVKPRTIPFAPYRFDPLRWYLSPGQLYLGTTMEEIELHGACGTIMGRSTIARYGISVESAGFVDDGFIGTITLEITVARPVWVYAGDRVCQLTIEPVLGPRRPYGNNGHYHMQKGVRPPEPIDDRGHGVVGGHHDHEVRDADLRLHASMQGHDPDLEG